VQQALGQTIAREFEYAALGGNRDEALHAEFNCFFDDPIHFVAGREALNECERTREFGFSWIAVPKSCLRCFSIKIKHSGDFSALTIKEHNVTTSG
jgi:hypothetical protein